MKKKRRIKWKNVILFIIFIISLSCLILSTYNIIKWKIDNKKTNDQLENINDNVNIENIKDNDNTEIINNNESEDKSNPYWDYIKMNLINVNFNELKKTNKNVVGWIKVNGTNINYPFVQTDNNKYYLTHSFNNSYNSAGWVFLDYRNNIKNMDKNTIIYAHGRLDGIMFGSLKNILKSNWVNDKDNYIVKLSTETENTLWQVFSVYRIPTTNDYLRIEFNDNNDFLKFATTLLNRSSFNFNTKINENDKILTLSTCYNDNDKVVLHAKLIKKEVK